MKRRGDDTVRPRILLAGLDPYLSFVISQRFPAAEIVEMPSDILPSALEGSLDAIVITLDDPRARELTQLMRGVPVVAVADAEDADAARRLVGRDAVLARPFLPAEVQSVLSRALHLPEPLAPSAAVRLATARAWGARARVGAAALAAVLEMRGSAVGSGRAWILTGVFLYATFRLVSPGPRLLWNAIDVGFASALVTTTGGIASPYAPFAVVVAAAAGLDLGVRLGAAAGIIIASAASIDVVSRILSGRMRAADGALWFSVACLAGISGGFGARATGRRESDATRTLREANDVLSTLYRLARALPGGLELPAVTSSVLEELGETLNSSAAVFILVDASGCTVAGASGLYETPELPPDVSTLRPLLVNGPRAVSPEDLPTPLRVAFEGQTCVLLAPVRRHGALGLIICACPNERMHSRNLAFLRELADETAVAVENAQIFSRVREMSVDEERRRLARELHDGAAQGLAHLRLELKLMARQYAGGAVQKELRRLGAVAARVENEVRELLSGLHSAARSTGLVPSLRSFIRDLARLGGPEFAFEVRGVIRAPVEVEAEIFRVAQEAVWNALRHARAHRIDVSLTGDDDRLDLLVEDDGIGIGTRSHNPGNGLGLQTMRERAERIGATVRIEPAGLGGTRVVLTREPGLGSAGHEQAWEQAG